MDVFEVETSFNVKNEKTLVLMNNLREKNS